MTKGSSLRLLLLLFHAWRAASSCTHFWFRMAFDCFPTGAPTNSTMDLSPPSLPRFVPRAGSAFRAITSMDAARDGSFESALSESPLDLPAARCARVAGGSTRPAFAFDVGGAFAAGDLGTCAFPAFLAAGDKERAGDLDFGACLGAFAGGPVNLELLGPSLNCEGRMGTDRSIALLCAFARGRLGTSVSSLSAVALAFATLRRGTGALSATLPPGVFGAGAPVWPSFGVRTGGGGGGCGGACGVDRGVVPRGAI